MGVNVLISLLLSWARWQWGVQCDIPHARWSAARPVEGCGFSGSLGGILWGDFFFWLVFLCCVGCSAFTLFSLPTLAVAGAHLKRTSSLLVCLGNLCVVKLLWLKAAYWTQGGTKQQRIQSKLLCSLCSAGACKAMRERGHDFYTEVLRQGSQYPGDKDACRNSLPTASSSLTPTGHLTHCPMEPQKQMHPAAVCPCLPGRRCPGKPSWREGTWVYRKSPVSKQMETDNT